MRNLLQRYRRSTNSLYAPRDNIVLRATIFLLLFISILIFVGFLSKQKSYPYTKIATQAQVAQGFSFTAGGDHGGTSDTTANLTYIASSGANFHLALGDLSYDSFVPESAWCDYVKANVGASFPFQLVSGNHEEDTRVDGFIDNFAACLPDRMSSIGSYAKEYYFDYPATDPLTRVIMLAAALTINGEKYDYVKANTHYTWLSNAIDSARTAGIKWVVVGMHKNCVTMGIKPTCSIGSDLMNLLLEKKVDLILQGHEHNYQRSKQLSFSSQCSSIAIDSYNNNCVVDDGSDNQYVYGAGSVVVIAGTFGVGLVSINTSDPEAPYFVSWMGDNTNPTKGIVKFDVNSTQLSAQFVPVVAGAFADNFTILESGAPLLPTSTPTPTPVVTTFPFAPTEDTHVRADLPNNNYGASTTLESDGSPIKVTYMKYDLTSLAGRIPVSAKLRMKVTNSSSSIENVKEVLDTSWTEATMTYNNRRSVGSIVKTFPGGASGGIVEVDVTPAVLGRLGQVISLAVDSTGSDGFAFYSRNNATDKVTLIIEVQSDATPTPTPDLSQPTPTATLIPTPTSSPTPAPTLTPTPTPGNIVTLNPIADTYVRKDKSSSNFGLATALQSDGSPVKIVYMKYDLSSLVGKTLIKATLHMGVVDSSRSIQNAEGVADTTWSETGMTYNNRPATEAVITSFPGGVSGTYVGVDITAGIANKLGQVTSLAIESAGTDGFDFYSKDSATNKVSLILELQ